MSIGDWPPYPWTQWAYPIYTPTPQLTYMLQTDSPTLRDWFAGQALVNRDASWFADNEVGRAHLAAMAKRAYEIADAMLAARIPVTIAPQPEQQNLPIPIIPADRGENVDS